MKLVVLVENHALDPSLKQEHGLSVYVEKDGFHIVYDKDVDEPVGNGFFFTIGYKDMSGGELLGYLLQCGVSGIVLTSTGAVYEGIRACSSAIKPHHYDLLDQRLAMFEEMVK
jgi:hypothetical protein